MARASELPADLVAGIGTVMGAVLVRAPLAADDDFFDCGGDSLGAIEVLQRIVTERRLADSAQADELQAELLNAIFEDASPVGLASVLLAHQH